MHSSLSTSLLEPLWMRWPFYNILTWAPFIAIVYFHNPSSKPYHMINIITIFFTINTMIDSITMINTRFQPIWRRSPAWPQVVQWLSPPAFYSASQTPASSHRWKARPCQRRHFFIAHPSAGLISGHLSSGRSVEAASTCSIWHFQVPPGWKKTTN